ncbi:MAG TPA: hypothetical protein VGG75_13670 [Trebonia sp.]|jgi:hypothetical protein
MPWTFEDTIKDIQHVSWYWPDGIHTRDELRVLEPGRRNYDSPCPCACGEGNEEA